MRSDPMTAVFWVLVVIAAACFGYVGLVGCDWHWWTITGDPHLLGWFGVGTFCTLIATVVVDR